MNKLTYIVPLLLVSSMAFAQIDTTPLYSADTLVRIPRDTIAGKVYYRYTVQKSIGLWRIAKNFGVSQEDILKANPGLAERGLRFDEPILIPAMNAPQALAQPVATTLVTDSAPAIQPIPRTGHELPTNAFNQPAPIINPIAANIPMVDSATDQSIGQDYDSTDSVILPFTGNYRDTITIAYLLPLQANALHRSAAIDRFYDFYAGALLALREAPDSIYYDIRTFDIQRGDLILRELLANHALDSVDAIIGPAYASQVAIIAEWTLNAHKPVILPFLSNIPQLATNPYLIQFNSSESTQAGALARAIAAQPNANVVLVDAPQDAIPQSIRTLRDSLTQYHLASTTVSIRQILADSVFASLPDSASNYILFNSERFSNIQLLLPYLRTGKRGRNLTLISQYSWDTDNSGLPVIYPSVFGSADSTRAASYDTAFRLYFNHSLSSTHPRYDRLGYDLTAFMIHYLSAPDPTSLWEGLQSNIQLYRIAKGGLENKHVGIFRQ